MVEEFSVANNLFYMSRLCSYKELEDIYETMDNLKKAQSYLDYNIRRSDTKCRHKRAAGIIVKRKKICFSIMMGKSLGFIRSPLRLHNSIKLFKGNIFLINLHCS